MVSRCSAVLAESETPATAVNLRHCPLQFGRLQHENMYIKIPSYRQADDSLDLSLVLGE